MKPDDSNEAIVWLRFKAEKAGKGCLDNLDARAVLRAIRQAEAAAVAREREAWQRWLNEAMAEIAKAPVEPDTAIVCGGEPSRGDLMTMGFMTCMLHWKAAIRARGETNDEA